MSRCAHGRPLLARTISAADSWAALTEKHRALRREIAAERCKYEEPYEHDTGAPGVPPCWAVQPFDRAESCEPCLRRRALFLLARRVPRRIKLALDRLFRASGRA